MHNRKLLSKPEDNIKIAKGIKLNVFTYSLFLASYNQNSKGVNLCPMAGIHSKQSNCYKTCIDFAGMGGRAKNVRDSRRDRADYFINHRNEFMQKLYLELQVVQFEGKITNKDIAIRLNGSTDIDFYNLPVGGFKNIFEALPDLKFYDYTKVKKRMFRNNPSNYHLTFSRSENNDSDVQEVLKAGGNVAVIFDKKYTPKKWNGYKVIDGDESDLRYLDPINCIVRLRYKDSTFKGAKAFNDAARKSNLVIKDPAKRCQINPKQ